MPKLTRRSPESAKRRSSRTRVQRSINLPPILLTDALITVVRHDDRANSVRKSLNGCSPFRQARLGARTDDEALAVARQAAQRHVRADRFHLRGADRDGGLAALARLSRQHKAVRDRHRCKRTRTGPRDGDHASDGRHNRRQPCGAGRSRGSRPRSPHSLLPSNDLPRTGSARDTRDGIVDSHGTAIVKSLVEDAHGMSYADRTLL